MFIAHPLIGDVMTISNIDARGVSALVEHELSRIDDRLVRDALALRLVEPELCIRDWDYSSTNERFPSWTVLKVEGSDIGIAYCQHGHGPRNPWGLVSLSSMWFGMDCGWFPHLEDAFVDSDGDSLLIWDVVGPDGAIVHLDRTLAEAFAPRDSIDAGLLKPVHHVEYRSRRPDGRLARRDVP